MTDRGNEAYQWIVEHGDRLHELMAYNITVVSTLTDLQAAIDADKKLISVVPGTTLDGTSATITAITLDDKDDVTIDFQGSTLNWFRNQYVFDLNDCNRVKIKNYTISIAGASGVGGATGCRIYVHGTSDNCVFENVRLYNPWLTNGATVFYLNGNTVTNTHLKDITNDGDRAVLREDGAQHTTLENIKDNPGSAATVAHGIYALFDASHNPFDDLIIDKYRSTNSRANGMGLDGTYSGGRVKASNIHIINPASNGIGATCNKFELVNFEIYSPGEHGVSLGHTGTPTYSYHLANGYIEDAAAFGVELEDDVNGFNMTGVTIKGSVKSGLIVSGNSRDISILGNHFDTNGTGGAWNAEITIAGYYAGTATKITIIGNTFKNATASRNGIVLGYSVDSFTGDIVITGNTFDVTGEPISPAYFRDATKCTGLINIYNNDGCSPSSEIRCYRVKNNSGGALARGDIVVLDTANIDKDEEMKFTVTTTTTAGDPKVFGMVRDATIANGEIGIVQTIGMTVHLKVDGTTDIAVGDYLGTFTTAKICQKVALGSGLTACAIALEAYSTDDSNGVIDALLITPKVI